MKSYRVIWEIDVEADTPEEAAKNAHLIQLDSQSTATVFTVKQDNASHRAVEIDLAEKST